MDPDKGAPFEVSTDPARLDLALIHEELSQRSYWALGRPLEVVRRSIANSLNFGGYEDGRQVAYARVVTDRATFAYLCDVFVVAGRRGRGAGKRLLDAVCAHPDLQGLRRFTLVTRDAHEFYRRHGGFEGLKNAERWMEKRGAPAG